MTQTPDPSNPEPLLGASSPPEVPQRMLVSGVRWPSFGAGYVQVSKLLMTRVFAALAEPFSIWLKEPETRHLLPFLGIGIFTLSTGVGQCNFHLRLLCS